MAYYLVLGAQRTPFFAYHPPSLLMTIYSHIDDGGNEICACGSEICGLEAGLDNA